MAAWLDERRSEARAALESTPLPTLKDENWRYTSLRGIDFDAFASVSGADATVRTPTVLGDLETAGELVQRGQDVVSVRLDDEVRAMGVVLSSLDDAVEAQAELVDRHLGSVLDLRDRFIAENSATWSGGGFVYVPAGVTVGLPLRLVVENPEAGARTLWRTLVVVEAGARLTLIEELAPGEPGYLNGALELVLGDGAEVDLVQTQELHHDSYHFTAARAEIARDATLRWFSLGLGGKLGKARQESRLGGPGSAVRATGLYALGERQHLDLDTSQEHAAPNAVSDLAYKGALRGHAHADSIPGLQILANDVRCTHAATVSRVDSELLFFLMARGFARAEAEQMLVTAFYADALSRIENLALRERFAAALALRTG